ncbi:metal ABC transporter solute-binding protein, Zn/Mn family [Corynebacterium lizhenjunii]|uniref:metal ABC transporter solute-binding protein, Zn/Mn family n=1 Tax=Corynebacterium lizhenjunii TaxID=2709394 RepID=UPI0013ECCBDD|nr:zinc ABC transporter substrate-binding protein [Corynebacterium lizhenjunii]
MTNLARLAAATLLALTLSSCSSSGQPAASSGAGGGAGEEAINIVASTPIWAHIAQEVADTVASNTPVTVTSVITNPDVDPHHFEPTAADVARANDADIAVVGGGGYDAWLYQAMSNQDAIISALPLVDHGGLRNPDAGNAAQSRVEVIDGNEHVWYDIDAITLVAKDVASAINALDPDAGASAETVVAKTTSVRDRLAALPARTYAQTEPIADYLLAPAPWTDKTPEKYRAVTLSEGEPAAADLARFLQAVKARDFDLLIYNPQTQTDLTQRIHDAAEAAGMPIVEIGETPVGGENFFDYYEQVLGALEKAASQAGADPASQAAADPAGQAASADSARKPGA